MKNGLGKKMDATKTLFGRFIEKKVNDYLEPLRKGTPRGEPIGLSGPKYAATLICLYRLPLRKIAEKVRVSYGLLRKWRTEEGFQKPPRNTKRNSR